MLLLKNITAPQFLDKFFTLENLSFDVVYDNQNYKYNIASYNDKEKDGGLIVTLNLTAIETKDENENWTDIQYKYLFLEFYMNENIIKFSEDLSNNKTKTIIKSFVNAVINA